MTSNTQLKILTAVGVASVLASAFMFSAAASKPTSFNARWSNAMQEIVKVQAPIPQAKLHARALEILRSMEVAQGDE
jgi:hypothetical protein